MSLPDETGLTLAQRLRQDLKSDLIAGLLVVIPLATTIWLTTTVARWVVEFLTSIPRQLNPFIGLNPVLGDLLNLTIGLAVPLFSILIIGLMARNIAGRWLLDFGERTLKAIPLAGSVYSTLKQILETLLGSSDRFRRVVLVEYPRPRLWTLAFVTGGVATGLNPVPGEEMLSIFIPTTPNPTSGWYAIVPQSDVIQTSLSVENAFKVLISGGIVDPSTLGIDGERLNRSTHQARLAVDRQLPSPLSSPPLEEALEESSS